MQPLFEGGCHCGFIRYRAFGDSFDQCHCHCTDCRRSSGAPFVSWATFRTANFEMIEGELAKRCSSDTAERGFCPKCGAQISFQYQAAPDEIDITIASMDDPDLILPQDHLWTQSKIAWIHLADGLPEWPQRRGH